MPFSSDGLAISVLLSSNRQGKCLVTVKEVSLFGRKSLCEAGQGPLSSVVALPAGPPAVHGEQRALLMVGFFLLSFASESADQDTDTSSDATSQGLVLVAAHTELLVGVRTHSKAW